ncbi:MAG: carboxymuconolactone decarboxylase family protein [Gammaproteobacteria bacterium]|nr:carboxymuconolactone decarboxylase family protein [Gammaproteobacteria bacterium]
MSRLQPLEIDELTAAQRRELDRAEELLGFVPNDALIIARSPALMSALGALVAAVYAPGKVDPGLKRLLGLMTSSAAGCEYCVAHTAFTSQRHGVDPAKLSAIWDFETSDEFSVAEKQALRIALHAGQSPNGVSDEMFAALGKYFDADAQVEIVAVIAMFGFLNRWNSTLATDVEARPADAAELIRR